MPNIKIYQRSCQIYVAPTNGLAELEPIEIVNRSDDLASALGRALKAAQDGPGEHPDLRHYKSPVQKAASVRSTKEFERGLKLLSLDHVDGAYVATRYVPAPDRGLDPDEVVFRLSDDVELRLLAAAVEKSFADSKWRTRS